MAPWSKPAAAVVLCALATFGCGSKAVKAPNPTRSLDERRAVEVIRRAISGEGVRPAAGRDVKLTAGGTLFLDVGIANRKYGIAYISETDAQNLGDGIPPRNRRDERLRLIRGGDGTVRIVLLYQGNYVYDDLVGESHERTTITAERQLTRQPWRGGSLDQPGRPPSADLWHPYVWPTRRRRNPGVGDGPRCYIRAATCMPCTLDTASHSALACATFFPATRGKPNESPGPKAQAPERKNRAQQLPHTQGPGEADPPNEEVGRDVRRRRGVASFRSCPEHVRHAFWALRCPCAAVCFRSMGRASVSKRMQRAGAVAFVVGASSLGGSQSSWAQSPTSGSPTTGSPTSPTRPSTQQPVGPPVYGAPPPGYGAPPPGYGAPPPPPPYALGPEKLEYDEDRPIPPGYHVESSVRKGLVIGGAVTFGAVYLFNVLIAIPLTAVDDDFTPLYVPVAGPFITIFTENSEGAGTTALAIDGVVQTGGLIMLVLGLALQKTELVRDDYYEEAIRVEPMVLGDGSMGLGVRGNL